MANTADARRKQSPYTTEVPADVVSTSYALEKVEPTPDDSGWFISFDGGMGIFMPRLTDDQPTPEVGDVYSQYGNTGLGSRASGQALNGRVIWYRTKAMEDYVWQKEREKYQQERLEADLRGLKLATSLYDALPALLKRRIDRQRRENPDRLGEHMELQLLRDAAAIVEACESAGIAVSLFRELSYNEQIAMVPLLEETGHSGSSFGYTVSMAAAIVDGTIQKFEDDADASVG